MKSATFEKLSVSACMILSFPKTHSIVFYLFFDDPLGKILLWLHGHNLMFNIPVFVTAPQN